VDLIRTILILDLVIVVGFFTNISFHYIGDFLKFFSNLYMVATNLALLYLFCLPKHFNTTAGLFNIGVQLDADDVFFNFILVEIQLMNGVMPSIEPRKKDHAFMQISIEALIKPSVVVVDAIASINTSLC
jgi:hypothetical protein